MNPQTQENNPHAVNPAIFANMPETSRNPSGPVTRNWATAGEQLAQTILAAEQGIVVANENLSQTRLNGLMELAFHEDAVERSQFIVGVQSTFAAKDGDKVGKAHMNYVAELRRVSTSCLNNGVGPTIEILKGTGSYKDIVARIPRASTQGGSNKGTGAQAVQDATKDLIKEHGAEAAQAAVTEAAKQLSSPPPKQEENTYGTDEMVKAILFCHENQIEPNAHALATRCKASTNRQYQELGQVLEKHLLAMELGPHAEQMLENAQKEQGETEQTAKAA